MLTIKKTHKEPQLIRAKLTQEIEYFKFERCMKADKGTLIIVDVANGIAMVNGDHVDIGPTEYMEVLYS